MDTLIAQRIIRVILFQAQFGLCLVLVIALFVTLRKGYRAHRRRLNQRYFDSVSRALCEVMNGAPPPSLPRARFAWERHALAEALFSHINALEGAERRFFVEQYERSGLLARDRRAVLSRSWQVRLEAVLRLGKLGRYEESNLLAWLLDDPNALVATSALLALSQLHSQRGTFAALEPHLVRLARRNRTAFLEALALIAAKEGIDWLVNQTNRIENPEVTAGCLRCLGELKFPAGNKAIGQFLREGPRRGWPLPLLEEALRAAAASGDPRLSRQAEPYLNHPSPALRERAAEACARLSPGIREVA